jgi:hypothetical protein
MTIKWIYPKYFILKIFLQTKIVAGNVTAKISEDTTVNEKPAW